MSTTPLSPTVCKIIDLDTAASSLMGNSSPSEIRLFFHVTADNSLELSRYRRSSLLRNGEDQFAQGAVLAKQLLESAREELTRTPVSLEQMRPILHFAQLFIRLSEGYVREFQTSHDGLKKNHGHDTKKIKLDEATKQWYTAKMDEVAAQEKQPTTSTKTRRTRKKTQSTHCTVIVEDSSSPEPSRKSAKTVATVAKSNITKPTPAPQKPDTTPPQLPAVTTPAEAQEKAAAAPSCQPLPHISAAGQCPAYPTLSPVPVYIPAAPPQAPLAVSGGFPGYPSLPGAAAPLAPCFAATGPTVAPPTVKHDVDPSYPVLPMPTQQPIASVSTTTTTSTAPEQKDTAAPSSAQKEIDPEAMENLLSSFFGPREGAQPAAPIQPQTRAILDDVVRHIENPIARGLVKGYIGVRIAEGSQDRAEMEHLCGIAKKLVDGLPAMILARYRGIMVALGNFRLRADELADVMEKLVRDFDTVPSYVPAFLGLLLVNTLVTVAKRTATIDSAVANAIWLDIKKFIANNPNPAWRAVPSTIIEARGDQTFGPVAPDAKVGNTPQYPTVDQALTRIRGRLRR